MPVSFFGGGMAPVGSEGMDGAGGGVAGFGLGGGKSAIILSLKINTELRLSNFIQNKKPDGNGHPVWFGKISLKKI